MTAIAELLSSIHIQTIFFLIGISVWIQSGLIWFQSLMIQEYRGIRLAGLGTFFYHIKFNGHEISLTVSIGVGNSAFCENVDNIFKSSDMALYKAKKTRNAVALHYDPV